MTQPVRPSRLTNAPSLRACVTTCFRALDLRYALSSASAEAAEVDLFQVRRDNVLTSSATEAASTTSLGIDSTQGDTASWLERSALVLTTSPWRNATVEAATTTGPNSNVSEAAVVAEEQVLAAANEWGRPTIISLLLALVGVGVVIGVLGYRRYARARERRGLARIVQLQGQPLMPIEGSASGVPRALQPER